MHEQSVPHSYFHTLQPVGDFPYCRQITFLGLSINLAAILHKSSVLLRRVMSKASLKGFCRFMEPFEAASSTSPLAPN